MDPEAVADRLLELSPGAQGYCVAFSGGADSTALLHLVSADPRIRPLRALHVHHGLDPAADRWEAHCREACDALPVPLTVRRVHVPPSRHGLEAAAREARYRAFEGELARGECLVQAHHADDQAETVLFRLIRGSGARGLTGIPARRALGGAWVVRPLLGFPREGIHRYLDTVGARWIDDQANRDPRFDRTYLRQEVLPVLERRWPGAAARIARSAEHLSAAVDAEEELAARDLAHVRVNGLPSVAGLRRLPGPRAEALLRLWLRLRGAEPPGARRLRAGLRALLDAREDGAPALEWPGGAVRRHQGSLHFVPARSEAGGLGPSPRAGAGNVATSRWGAHWDLRGSLRGPWGVLRATWSPDPGLTPELLHHGVHLHCRATAPAGAQRRVKKAFQQAGVPPWERACCPLVFAGPRLVALAGRWVDPRWRGAPGLKLLWDGTPSHQ